jgi:hypothetical protein
MAGLANPGAALFLAGSQSVKVTGDGAILADSAHVGFWVNFCKPSQASIESNQLRYHGAGSAAVSFSIDGKWFENRAIHRFYELSWVGPSLVNASKLVEVSAAVPPGGTLYLERFSVGLARPKGHVL